MTTLDDALRYGVAIGDRQAIWQLLHDLPPERQVAEVFEAIWPPQPVSPTDAAAVDTDTIVRGMFQMICHHLQSPLAVAAFAPLQLLVLLRGEVGDFDGFVTTLGAPDDPLAPHLMVIRPGVFVTLADRLLRAFTCAEVWPELGDLATCQTDWLDTPLTNQPQDPERFQLAMNLAMLSALVVFYHELAHIIRGHNAWSAASLGAGRLRENQPLASLTPAGMDDRHRALEVDADIYAGVFLARVLKEGLLGEVNADSLPYWCELMAFLAAVTFNVFEDHVQRADYRAGYHLPGIRTECFLEGMARTWEADLDLFLAGSDAGFAFCAQHYRGLDDEGEIDSDLARLQQHTWPTLMQLREAFTRYVPDAWFYRRENG